VPGYNPMRMGPLRYLCCSARNNIAHKIARRSNTPSTIDQCYDGFGKPGMGALPPSP